MTTRASPASARTGGAPQNAGAWWDQFLNDLRYAARSLWRARGFTLTVLLTLILGIGVTTLVYDLTQWIIFRASPYPRPQELYFAGTRDSKNDIQYGQAGFYLQGYREQTSVFSEYAAVNRPVSIVVLAGQPIPEGVANLWKETLQTLGIQPVLGRGFLPEEYTAGKNDVVIISDLIWRKYFNAAPDILGRQLTIDRQVCTVVGVLGRDQQWPADFESGIYRPLVYRLIPDDVWSPSLTIIGRLKSDVTSAKALAAVSTLKLPPLPQWALAYMQEQKPLLTNITERNRPDIWWVMLAAAVFLYAISCLNATNLMLIRIMDRRRELSIRFAVGGSRWQVAQIVAIEGLLLSLAAWVMVTLFVRWGFPPIFRLLNNSDDASFQNYWDWRTLVCIGALSVFSCLVATIAPALRILRTDINSGLKEGGPSMGETRAAGRVRNLFVVLQAAFAVILLTGTGLMVRSFEQLSKVDLGFDPTGKVKVWVMPSDAYTLKPEARIQLFERVQARLGSLPGVRDVSYGQNSLLVGHFWGTAQLKMADGSYRATAGNFVAGNFQKAAGLTMLEGRWISDRAGAYECVINETMAKERFAGLDPVGRYIQLQISGDSKLPIVGVVKDVRDNMRTASGMRFYVSAKIYPPNVDTLILRMDKDPPKEFSDVVRRAIFELDPNLVTTDVQPMNAAVTGTMATEHYAYNILRGLAAIALVLTVVGIFSVIAFTVDSRMTEFGVRLALGATPSNLNRLVMRRGVAAAALGIFLGIAGALALTRFMASMLYETSAFDPLVYGAVAALLLVSAVAACWLPARRAARVDVIRLLKSD